jgi:predicted metal-binding protein
MIIFIFFLLFGEFVARCLGQIGLISDYWLFPRENETVTNGSYYNVTWTTNLLDSFPGYCSECDITNVNLCLQPLNLNWPNYSIVVTSTCSRF